MMNWTYNITVGGRITKEGQLTDISEFFQGYPGDYWILRDAGATFIAFENWDNAETVWFYHNNSQYQGPGKQRAYIHSEDLF